VRASVHLPANTEATLQQTTLLGEKYVALGPPVGADGTPVQAVGSLKPGAVLPADDTENLPDVETVFGLLSNVLNGGSLGSLQTINIEITKALAGREGQVRDALKQLDTFVSGLDTQKAQIVRALDELDRFSGALARQNTTIGNALDNLPSGLKVLADEQSQFTHLLTDLSTFGKVATRVITSSRAQTVADFRDLKPVLGHLAAAGSNLPHALEVLITFPFPKAFTYDSPGDYSGLKISLDADPILCSIIDMAGLPLVDKAGQPIVKCPSMTSNGGTKSSTSGTHKPTTTKQKPGSGKLPSLPQLPLGGLKSVLPTAPTKSSGGGVLGGVLGGVGGGG
jgi:phospholipid/cholesterol/gamma-HCH transport system substrate-binding protein